MAAVPKNTSIKKVLVIGSGPIIIGQAAEFDYAGTQACRTLKEEGIKVVLINSNPATIMTDTEIADRVYLEPLTLDFVEEVIKMERPDGLLPTLGGQVGLNMAEKLWELGMLEQYNLKLLGTSADAIKKAEDRKLFKNMMEELNEPVPKSAIVNSVEEALEFTKKQSFPVIVRPAYTLGGTGGGVANNAQELEIIASKGIKLSPISQLLIEQSVAGWKEIEYEVIRDGKDNCITICSMENIDPVGIHTGDSIVVAPTQTLSDVEHQTLRSASLKIIRALEIEGGCNIQYALHPTELKYYVIEVNPRVSRSSALASKATGYPIARVATKIAIGYSLDEITNVVTGSTSACFEPALDYVVVKIPRWPFDKFESAHRKLGSQMKATGEIMALGRNFESALLKGIRSLELDTDTLIMDSLKALSTEDIINGLKNADDRRLWVVAEGFRRGFTVEEIEDITSINSFFLFKIKGLVDWESKLATGPDKELLKESKILGFSDKQIGSIWEMSEGQVREMRMELGINVSYKMVDTCAGEFPAATPYYYSTYGEANELEDNHHEKVLVLGSGPIRIGQGIEFDYCSVHSSWALQEIGVESIVINNNPETVSTDFDTSDILFFEPLSEEEVLNVIEQEKPMGVITQFGGQTAINLAKPLAAAGVKLLGTSVENMDVAEDREKFHEVLKELDILHPEGRIAFSAVEVESIAVQLGFPVLVRPSYVLGGRAMEIVYNREELNQYLEQAVKISKNQPILVDRYILGREVEVDAISDGINVLIPGIMEHVERAGVHSGDSSAVYPSRSLAPKVVDKIIDYTTKLTKGLQVIGMLNIQYVVQDDQVYVIEANPRSSRTVPFISKVINIPLIKVATKIMMGKSLADQGFKPNYNAQTIFIEPKNLTAVKMPVFSFAKLTEVETSLGPEMKSTGEVLGLDADPTKAMYKALLAAGYDIPQQGTILATIADKDKTEALPMLKRYHLLGYNIAATPGTAQMLEKEGIPVDVVNKLKEGNHNVVEYIRKGKADLIINTLTRGKEPERDGFKIRRAAVEYGVACTTSLDTAIAILKIMESMVRVKALQDYIAG